MRLLRKSFSYSPATIFMVCGDYYEGAVASFEGLLSAAIDEKA
jgi:hypothetical protein